MGLIWAIIVLYALKAHYALKVLNSAILPLKWPKWAIISGKSTILVPIWMKFEEILIEIVIFNNYL